MADPFLAGVLALAGVATGGILAFRARNRSPRADAPAVRARLAPLRMGPGATFAAHARGRGGIPVLLREFEALARAEIQAMRPEPRLDATLRHLMDEGDSLAWCSADARARYKRHPSLFPLYWMLVRATTKREVFDLRYLDAATTSFEKLVKER